MLKNLLSALALFLLIPFTARAQEPNLVAYAGFAGFQAPIWAPKDFGLFTKYGFNGDLVFLSGSVRQLQALLGNSIQLAQVDAATAVNAINQGADLVMFSGTLNSFPYSFITQKEIRKPEDLVGKKIGVLALGGATETATLLALRAWNIPRQAVTIFPAGDSASRIISLTAKAIDGTMLSYPDINEAFRHGLHEFTKMSDVKGSSFPMNVMVARRTWLEKNRDTVKRFQQAYAEGVYQFMNHKERAIAVLAKWLRFKNPKAIEETYQYFGKSFAFPTRVSHEGLRNTLEIIALRNPAVKVDMTISRYLDESIVDELDREGFFKRLAAK